MSEIKKCADCKWCEPEPNGGYDNAMCKNPNMAIEDKAESKYHLGIEAGVTLQFASCRFLRGSDYSGYCGKEARYFEKAEAPAN